jgi:hypothetical protein
MEVTQPMFTIQYWSKVVGHYVNEQVPATYTFGELQEKLRTQKATLTKLKDQAGNTLFFNREFVDRLIC